MSRLDEEFKNMWEEERKPLLELEDENFDLTDEEIDELNELDEESDINKDEE